jgi:hypothetical protein
MAEHAFYVSALRGSSVLSRRVGAVDPPAGAANAWTRSGAASTRAAPASARARGLATGLGACPERMRRGANAHAGETTTPVRAFRPPSSFDERRLGQERQDPARVRLQGDAWHVTCLPRSWRWASTAWRDSVGMAEPREIRSAGRSTIRLDGPALSGAATPGRLMRGDRARPRRLPIQSRADTTPEVFTPRRAWVECIRCPM